jgi:hypothetical protein
LNTGSRSNELLLGYLQGRIVAQGGIDGLPGRQAGRLSGLLSRESNAEHKPHEENCYRVVTPTSGYFEHGRDSFERFLP